MSKHHVNHVTEKLKELSSTESFVEFVNSRGIKMKLRPIPPYLVQMIYESVEKPEIPTYTVAIEGGGEETHKHDEISIAQSSDEEKAKWNLYKEKLSEMELKMNESVMNVILLEGVDVNSAEIDKVRGRFKIFGLTLPDDPTELELSFKRTYVLGTPEDAEFITSTVMKLTGIDQEDLSAIKNSFQS